MKIQSIQLFPVTIPLTEPIKWSFGTRFHTSKLYVKITTDNGLVGWGEGSGPMAMNALQAQIETSIAAQLIGENPFDIERIIRKCMGSGLAWTMEFGVFVIAGLEIALWDIMGKATGQPVARLLGGIFRKKVQFSGYIFINEPSYMANKGRAYKEAGFKTVKLKGGINTKHDIANVAAVRDAVGDDIEMRIDPNQVWSIGTAVQTIKKLEPYRLQYVEQPLRREDYSQFKNLRLRCTTPIGVNESIYTPENMLRIVQEESADVIVADIHNAGGLLGCKKVCAIAESAGLPLTLHSGAEMGIGLMAMAHLAASTPGFIFDSDTHYNYLADDILAEKIPFEDGTITISEAPGYGVEVDEDKLLKYATGTETTPFLDDGNQDWLPQAPGL